MGASDPLLRVQDLTIAFGETRRVSGLSLDVARGETVALVGESGSGKSLTGLAVMRLLPPAARVVSGTVLLAGRDILKLGEEEMRELRGRELAMIFQEPMTSLNPVLTVGDQIAEVLVVHEGLSKRAARARAIELLDLVRVPDPGRRVDDYPHRLSGGMRQRVMIAIAVACRPRLLIADEPTTALDVTIQAQILDLLDRLRGELALGLILITHDLGIVGQWADRVVVMYAGNKVEEATPDALFTNPRHPYTMGLLAASPRSITGRTYRDGPLAEIAGGIASAQGEPGCVFAPRCTFVRDTCRTAPPPLVMLSDGRRVACPVLNPAESSP